MNKKFAKDILENMENMIDNKLFTDADLKKINYIILERTKTIINNTEICIR